MSAARTIRTATVVAGLVGGAVPAASAATLHVSPHRLLRGSTTLPCTAERPCNLAFALSNAGPGDDVAMAPGRYRPPTLTQLQTQGPYTQSLEVKAGVVLHGEPGAALPVIHSSVPAIAPAVAVQSGGAIRDVAVEATAPAATPPSYGYGYGAMVFPNSVVERSRIRWTGVAGTVGTACSMVGGTVRDSGCLGTGSDGYAHALTGTGPASRPTAWATSPPPPPIRSATASAWAPRASSRR